MQEPEGKLTVVTGAGSVMGRATAEVSVIVIGGGSTCMLPG